jgi:5-methylthioadenosine/S-adenosylhomocysteine deaminase
MIPMLLVMALAQAAPVDLLVTGGTVVTVDREMRVLEGASVAIRDGRIDAVIPAGQPLPAAREIVDAAGRLVIPGLVNAHGHAPMVLLRGAADDMKLMQWLNEVIFPAEAKNVDPDFSYWGTLLAGIEMAKSGTTTFADMYYHEDVIGRATMTVGLRAVLGQTIIGFPAPDFKTTDDSLAATESFILKFKDHPRIVPGPGPHAIYTTPMEVVKKARELSKKYSVPFQIHAAESPEEDKEVMAKFGKTTVAVLDEAGILGPGVILHHATTLSDADMKRLAALGVATSHNPESNMKVASGLARVPDQLAAGVTVGLGTDGAATNNNLDMFETMDYVAKIHKLARNDPTAMPARDVFRLATMGGAAALSLGDRIGSIEAGKLADVVVVDVEPAQRPIYDVYSHLVYVTKGASVRTTIVQGQVIMRDRRMVTVNEEEVVARALEIQQQVLRTLGRPAAPATPAPAPRPMP